VAASRHMMAFLRKAAFLQKAWSKALPGKAWPNSNHFTPSWDLRQVPNRGDEHKVGLMETTLPRKGGIWQAVNVLAPDRCLGRSKIS